jgi:hypothetical protein
MAELIVKGQSFNYPDPGREPGWGEDATEWAKAITEALSEVLSGGDIIKAQATLNTDTTVPGSVNNLAFISTQTRQADVMYVIKRGSLQENGKMTITFENSSWLITREFSGDDTGAVFTVSPTGQVLYTLNNTPALNATMYFRAITLGV